MIVKTIYLSLSKSDSSFWYAVHVSATQADINVCIQTQNPGHAEERREKNGGWYERRGDVSTNVMWHNTCVPSIPTQLNVKCGNTLILFLFVRARR